MGGLTFGLARSLPFALNAPTYLGSAATIASLVIPSDRRTNRPRKPDRSGRRELLAGIAYLRGDRAVRALVMLPAAAGFFGWMPEATFVLFVRDHLGVNATGFGLLLAATTLGAVVGGLLTGPVVHALGSRRTLHLAYVAYGLILIPVGLITNPVVLAVLFFVQGMPLIACNATTRSLQQERVPGYLLGRVGAVSRFAYSALTPLGLAAGGFLAGWLGYPAVWSIAGCGFLAAFAASLPALRSLDDATR